MIDALMNQSRLRTRSGSRAGSRAIHLSILFLLVSLVLLSSTARVSAHEEEGAEQWLVVPNFAGNLQLETDHFAPQWNGGRELVFDSAWDHEISMVALNNGTHIYFHLRWTDQNRSISEDDGVAIFFESAGPNGTDDVWLWSTLYGFSSSPSVRSAAVWKDDYWNVAFGRSLTAPTYSSVNLTVRESKEEFLKVGVWDGSLGHSFDQLDPEGLPHLNMYILPYFDYYPKDGLVWLSVLGVGLAVFTYRELRVSGWRKRK